MSINLQLPKLTDMEPRLTVIGVGGAGCNAVNNMIAAGLSGVEFVVANTDAQALAASSAEHRIQLGTNLTEGLGAGARPEIGQAAAEEAVDEIRTQVSGSHMVFLAAGMGGGTGTGAASVIARVAREQGILTVGVVTKPFQFEGTRRMRVAEAGIAELMDAVDTLIVIPNQNLFRIANEKTTFAEAFVLADHVLYSGVACIVDLILKEGLINLDFADVRSVMAGMGTAMMGTGEAGGERRATLAAEEAISNPLLDDISLDGAKGLLLSITGGPDLTLYDVDEAASRVRQEVDAEATVIVGATFDNTLEDRIRVSIVASGMDRVNQPRKERDFVGFNPASGGVTTNSGEQDSAKVPVAQEQEQGQGQGQETGATIGEEPPQEQIGVLGTDGSPEAVAMSVDDMSAPAQPPPVPHGGVSEVQHQLSEAIQPEPGQARPETVGVDPSMSGDWSGGENQASVDEAAVGIAAQGYDQTDSAPVQWHGADGVTIEEGLPPMARPGAGVPVQAVRAGEEYRSHDHAAAQFVPEQPPANVRRPARRMPAVEDFPVVGQREYHAHVGSQPQGDGRLHDRGHDSFQQSRHQQGQPSEYSQSNTQPSSRARVTSQPQPHQQQLKQEPTRKKGLFERLTGLGRKRSDSFFAPDVSGHGRQKPVGSAKPQRHAGTGAPVGADGRSRDNHGEQRSELPEFFSGRRKG